MTMINAFVSEKANMFHSVIQTKQLSVSNIEYYLKHIQINLTVIINVQHGYTNQ